MAAGIFESRCGWRPRRRVTWFLTSCTVATSCRRIFRRGDSLATADRRLGSSRQSSLRAIDNLQSSIDIDWSLLMALLTALFATVLLMGLGLSVLLLGSAETILASHDRDARALGYASRAAAAVAAADLRALPSWAFLAAPGVVPEASLTPGQFLDSTLAPAAPWGGPALDLRALTNRLQAGSEGAPTAQRPAPPRR